MDTQRTAEKNGTVDMQRKAEKTARTTMPAIMARLKNIAKNPFATTSSVTCENKPQFAMSAAGNESALPLNARRPRILMCNLRVAFLSVRAERPGEA